MFIPPRNNLAVIELEEGRAKRALALALEATRVDPGYVFSHVLLARARLRTGDRAGAAQTLRTAIRLYRDRVGTDPAAAQRDAEDAAAIIGAAGELEDDEAVLAIAGTLPPQPPLARGLKAQTYCFAGVAAFNLGRFDQADRYWGEAVRIEPRFGWVEYPRFAASHIARGDVPPIRLPYATELPELRDPGIPEIPGFARAVLVHSLWSAKDEIAAGAMAFLDRSPDPWATELLRRLLTARGLRDEQRMRAAMALRRKGAVQPGTPLRMRIGNRLREVRVETREVDLGRHLNAVPEARRLSEAALRARNAGDLAEAERLYRKALDIQPELVPAMVNLANVLRSRKQPEAAREWLEKAARTVPMPVVLFNLAVTYAELKNWEAAAGAFDQLLRPPEVPGALRDPATGRVFGDLPAEAWANVYQSAADAYFRAGRFRDAERALRAGKKRAPGDPRWDELLASVRAVGRVSTALRNLQRTAQESALSRARKEIARPVGLATPLVEHLRAFSKDDLMAIARHRGMRYYARPAKDVLAARLTDMLRDDAAAAAERLAPQERDALEWLLSRGGVAPLTELQERLRGERGDGGRVKRARGRRSGETVSDPPEPVLLELWSDSWRSHEGPRQPLNRLRFAGLVGIGTLASAEAGLPAGTVVAIIPADVRARIRL